MDFGIVIAIGSLLLTSVLVAAIVGGSWALGRQHERRNFLERSGGLEDTAARLKRIEHLLETLSTDVERISEERTMILPPPR
ncbi:MAG: hypothetical protein H0U13_09355 [Gemmatimonadaceae bacterium]|nr:hypothetical protein [Gemmatimonadaceae bacterium]